jgi:peptidoglycan/LPS O-acetylase OafA/YrhL
MYALLPLLFAWALRFPSLLAMSGAWLLAIAIAGAEYMLRPGISDTAFLLTRYFPCFLAGVFAWRATKISRGRLPAWTWPVFVLALVALYRLVDALRVYGPGALVSLHGVLRNDHHIWWPPYLDLVADWIFCAAAAMAIPLFLQLRSRWLKYISNRIARYSYGIYVSHVPVFWISFTLLRHGAAPVRAAFALLLTALLSMLLYHGLEAPAITAGKRLATRMVRSSASS